PPVTPTPTATTAVGSTATVTPAVPEVLAGDWPSYLLGNNGFNSHETMITTTTAPNLRQYWTYHAGGGISAQPVLVNGVIYWGSWDGYEHATNLKGEQLWATNLGKTTGANCDPASAGVASTPTVTPIMIGG